MLQNSEITPIEVNASFQERLVYFLKLDRVKYKGRQDGYVVILLS